MTQQIVDFVRCDRCKGEGEIARSCRGCQVPPDQCRENCVEMCPECGGEGKVTRARTVKLEEFSAIDARQPLPADFLDRIAELVDELKARWTRTYGREDFAKYQAAARKFVEDFGGRYEALIRRPFALTWTLQGVRFCTSICGDQVKTVRFVRPSVD